MHERAYALEHLFLINKPYFETNFRLYVSALRLTTYLLLCELDMYSVYITQNTQSLYT